MKDGNSLEQSWTFYRTLIEHLLNIQRTSITFVSEAVSETLWRQKVDSYGNICIGNRISLIFMKHGISIKTYRTFIEHLSYMYRPSNEHLWDRELTSNEHLSNIQQTSNEHLLDIYRTSNEHLSPIQRTSIEHPTDLNSPRNSCRDFEASRLEQFYTAVGSSFASRPRGSTSRLRG